MRVLTVEFNRMAALGLLVGTLMVAALLSSPALASCGSHDQASEEPVQTPKDAKGGQSS